MIRFRRRTPALLNAWLVSQQLTSTHARYGLRVWRENQAAVAGSLAQALARWLSYRRPSRRYWLYVWTGSRSGCRQITVVKQFSAESAGSSWTGFFARSSLDTQVKRSSLSMRESTWMSNKEKGSIQLLQGTLDLIVLRTLATMGPQHAYQIATRLQQISDRLLNLNQGTLYPGLVRLEQYGWIKGTWGRTESNREAKYYEITKAGQKALGEETKTWRRMSALVERLLLEES